MNRKKASYGDENELAIHTIVGVISCLGVGHDKLGIFLQAAKLWLK